MGIRRSAASYLAAAKRPASLATPNTGSAQRPLPELTAPEAAELNTNINDSDTRLRERSALLTFAAKQDDAAGHAMQLKQLAWLIEHEPGAEVLASEAALMRDSTTAKQVENLWLESVAKSPVDGAVLSHATWFLQFYDLVKAEELLIPAAPKVGGAAAWLGELYATGALGGKRADTAAGKVAESEFGMHARQILRLTDDARVVLAASAAVSARGKEFASRGPLPEGFSDFCNELLTRAKSTNPATPDTCEFPPAKSGAGRQRLVKSAELIKKVAPSYPSGAKALRIQGTVTFSATVEKDGSVGNLELLTGPLVLYDESRKAVSKWHYSPTTLDGEPVAVSIRIDVNYQLSTY